MTCVAPWARTSRARWIVRMPPPTRHTRSPQTYLHQLVVVAGADRGVEIDQLELRERGEAPDPPVQIGVFEGEAFALDGRTQFGDLRPAPRPRRAEPGRRSSTHIVVAVRTNDVKSFHSLPRFEGVGGLLYALGAKWPNPASSGSPSSR